MTLDRATNSLLCNKVAFLEVGVWGRNLLSPEIYRTCGHKGKRKADLTLDRATNPLLCNKVAFLEVGSGGGTFFLLKYTVLAGIREKGKRI